MRILLGVMREEAEGEEGEDGEEAAAIRISMASGMVQPTPAQVLTEQVAAYLHCVRSCKGRYE